MNNEEAYSRIQKKIKLKKGFYIHFGIYLIIIFFLFILNWLTNDGRGSDDWWFLFPAASWGVAIAIHAMSVFVFSDIGIFGEDWENKKIEEELNKRGLSSEKPALPKAEDLDMDQHLDLKPMEKKPNYDERDLV